MEELVNYYRQLALMRQGYSADEAVAIIEAENSK